MEKYLKEDRNYLRLNGLWFETTILGFVILNTKNPNKLTLSIFTSIQIKLLKLHQNVK